MNAFHTISCFSKSLRWMQKNNFLFLSPHRGVITFHVPLIIPLFKIFFRTRIISCRDINSLTKISHSRHRSNTDASVRKSLPASQPTLFPLCRIEKRISSGWSDASSPPHPPFRLVRRVGWMHARRLARAYASIVNNTVMERGSCTRWILVARRNTVPRVWIGCDKRYVKVMRHERCILHNP